MQYLSDLGDKLSEITAYDVKSAYDKAKSMVLNYSEVETRVREATNNDSWGASSTLMQQIAQDSFNYQHCNEIMHCIFSRFSEKEAREWRQIYKSLQLLEYLVKNGSERVIDEARSHLSMIKMLRSFHYIDDKGKDQGINVRNRSKELAELLSDLDRVRQERKKAKANRSKYIGVEGGGGGGGMSFQSSSGSRYGGFGSDSYHGNASPSMGSTSPYMSNERSSNRRESFEEYDAGDDEDRETRGSSSQPSSARSPPPQAAPVPVKKDKLAAKVQEMNLFDFDDEPAPAVAAPTAPAAASSRKLSFDDDFDDFQSAGPSAAAAPAPAPAPAPVAARPAAPASSNFFDMMGSSSSAPLSPASAARPAQQPQMRTSQNMPAGPNYSGVGLFASPAKSQSQSQQNMQSMRPGMGGHSFSSSSVIPSVAVAQPNKLAGAAKSSGAFDFDDLFAMSGAKTTSSANKSTAGVAAAGTNSMASLAAQKGSSQLWGTMGSTSNGNNKANDDLLF